jgi:hypothetical protein
MAGEFTPFTVRLTSGNTPLVPRKDLPIWYSRTGSTKGYWRPSRASVTAPPLSPRPAYRRDW